MLECRLFRSIVAGGSALALAALASPSVAEPHQEALCPQTGHQLLPEQWLGVEPVRPIFPQSGAWLDQASVTFTWAPGIPATVELSRSRFFLAVVHHSEGTGEATVAMSLAEGVWFWRVRPEGFAHTSAVWSLQVAPLPSATPDGVGLAIGTDFDGDGLMDVIAPRDISMVSFHVPIETSDVRQTTLWSAHHSGCPVHNWVATPPEPKCGTITNSWAAGDVNGDGHGDVVSIDFEKNLYLYLGQNTLDIPRNITPSRLLRSGVLAVSRDSHEREPWKSFSLNGRGPGTPQTVVHGDMNGDGYSDFADGWYVFYGAADYQKIGIAALDWPPTVAFASGCDVNGDRFTDIATLSEDGKLRIYKGGSDGLGTIPYLTMQWTTTEGRDLRRS